ncbi:FUSC family protein [Acidisoma sp. C75]
MTDLRRSSFTIDLTGFSIQEGVRAGLSVAALVVLHAWFDFPLLLLTALGALLTCLADAGTPGEERLPPLFAFTLFGCLIGILYGLARAQGLWLAVPLAGIGIACASFARIYGPSGMQVGNLLSVWIVLAVDIPQPSLSHAVISGGMFAAGSLWAIVLTSLIWRIQPTVPLRHGIGDCYRALAAMIQDMRDILASRLSDEERAARWEHNGRVYRGGGRAAIETARINILDFARVHGNGEPRVSRAWLRLEALDQAFAAVSGLADILDAEHVPNRALALALLRHLRNEILVLAHSNDADRAPDIARMTQSLQRIGALLGQLSAYDPLRRLGETVTERLFVTVTLSAPENLRPGSLPDGKPALGWRERLWAPIRANLDGSSSHLRHAGMAGFAALLCLSYTLQNEHEYERWLTITLLMTMQPHFSLTWQRMLERIGGTVLGGLIAALLSLALHTPLTVSLAMFPLAVIAFTLRKVSFGLFLAALTPMIILLVEAATPGASEVTIALMRALYTVIGGALALVCSLALWPGRQPQRALGEVRAAIALHARFIDIVLGELLGEGSAAQSDAIRREAGIASNSLESALSRSMLEPRLVPNRHLNAALTIDAALRRISGRLTVLRVVWPAGTPAPPALALWRRWAVDSLAGMLSHPPGSRLAPVLAPRPRFEEQVPAPVADALLRLSRQIELIAGTLPKLDS